MMSLFSSFDIYYQYFPYFLVIMFIYFNMVILNKITMINKIMSNFITTIKLFFLSLMGISSTKMSLQFFSSFMIIIMILNFLSVLSYNFAQTSQISVVLFTSLSIWLSFLIFYNIFNMKSFMSHCIPLGTPIYMAWFIFLVELVSMMIRPITLSVRLVANILAGHLLMILLSQLIMACKYLGFMYLILNLIEMFVALIQSYIFSTLICLYYSESY